VSYSTQSNRLSFTSLSRDLCDDATCTTCHCSFVSFEAKIGNLAPTCFATKQAAGCRRVPSHRVHPLICFEAQTDIPSLGFEVQIKKLSRWFWGQNHQTIDLGFEAHIKKLSQWFWGQTTNKLSPSVLRLNQKTRASYLLHVYNANRTWHHPTSRSSSHWVPHLCLIIPDHLHQVSYSCLDLHRCPPCLIHHLHIMRQANTFLQIE
jgi:hypothetical protein